MTALACSTAQGAVADEVPRLTVRNVGLTLGHRVVLDDVSLTVRHGEIVGILGPNGCGKTSLFRCMVGALRAGKGDFEIMGHALSNASARSQMGVVFQDPSLDPSLSATENLVLGGQLYGLNRSTAQERASSLLEFVELTDRKNDRISHFSGGMKRRLELARALIHSPQVLLLDEPTTGLDPFAFDQTWKRLQALRRERNLSILLTTHRADEAAKCDRLIIMDRGHIVANDTPAALLNRVAGDVIVIEAERIEELVPFLQSKLDLTGRLREGRIHVEVQTAHTFIPRIFEIFEPGRLSSIAVRQPSLADSFYHLTGRALSQDNT